MNNHHRPHGTPEQPDEQEQLTAAALDAFITALDNDLQPPTPTALAPDDRGAFEMAARLRRQRATENPSADFVADLGAQLEALLMGRAGQDDSATAPRPAVSFTTAAPVDTQGDNSARARSAKRGPSRRAMLTGGLSAAAGLAAGVAGGIFVDHATTQASPPTGRWDVALVGGNGAWQPVALVTDVAPGTVKRFTTTNLVGHLIRRSDGSFYALSAACTHMGCIVAWNAGQHTFDCPCHNGRFDGQGTALPNQPIPYRPLPTIATKIADDTVYIWTPAAPAPSATPDTTPSSGGTYSGE
jgi:Rieske Fe-S protein